jgi:hypothetical protein
MSHIHTIVKVKASSPDGAIAAVKNLLTNDGEYSHPAPFDWFDEDATKISAECKTEADYDKLREEELAEYRRYLAEALQLPDDNSVKAYCLTRAGEALGDNEFWSTERLAYSMDWTEGAYTYYVETDRHY